MFSFHSTWNKAVMVLVVSNFTSILHFGQAYSELLSNLMLLQVNSVWQYFPCLECMFSQCLFLFRPFPTSMSTGLRSISLLAQSGPAISSEEVFLIIIQLTPIGRYVSSYCICGRPDSHILISARYGAELDNKQVVIHLQTTIDKLLVVRRIFPGECKSFPPNHPLSIPYFISSSSPFHFLLFFQYPMLYFSPLPTPSPSSLMSCRLPPSFSSPEFSQLIYPPPIASIILLSTTLLLSIVHIPLIALPCSIPFPFN